MFFLFEDQMQDGMPDHVRTFLNRDLISWGEMEQMLNGFREIKPDITVGTLLTFLHIARRASDASSSPAISLKVISEALGMSYQSAARHCDLLSEGVSGSGGLAWIAKSRNTQERGKVMQLSNGGLQVLIHVLGKLKQEDQSQQ